VRKAVESAIKLHPQRRPRGGEGAEGVRFTHSIEDSGPEKPGNGVEEKTLTTRETERGKTI